MAEQPVEIHSIVCCDECQRAWVGNESMGLGTPLPCGHIPTEFSYSNCAFTEAMDVLVCVMSAERGESDRDNDHDNDNDNDNVIIPQRENNHA